MKSPSLLMALLMSALAGYAVVSAMLPDPDATADGDVSAAARQGAYSAQDAASLRLRGSRSGPGAWPAWSKPTAGADAPALASMGGNASISTVRR